MSPSFYCHLIVRMRSTLLEPVPNLNGVLSSFEESRYKKRTYLASLYRQLLLRIFSHLSSDFLAIFLGDFFSYFSVLTAPCLTQPPTLFSTLLSTLLSTLFSTLLGRILLG